MKDWLKSLKAEVLYGALAATGSILFMIILIWPFNKAEPFVAGIPWFMFWELAIAALIACLLAVTYLRSMSCG